jgi:uncharacterized Zn finger protein
LPAEDAHLNLLADLEGLSRALALQLSPGTEPGTDPGQEQDLDLESLFLLLDQRDKLLEKLPAVLSLLEAEPALMARLESLSQHDTILISKAMQARLAIQGELQGLGRNFSATTSYLEQGNFEETSFYFENQG